MEIILIILALIAVVITGTLSKVEEAHNKIYAREHLSNQKYAVLGNKAVISIITFLVTGVGFFFVDIADSILALLALSMVLSIRVTAVQIHIPSPWHEPHHA